MECLLRHLLRIDQFLAQRSPLQRAEQISHLIQRAVAAFERSSNFDGRVLALMADAVCQEVDALLRRPLSRMESP